MLLLYLLIDLADNPQALDEREKKTKTKSKLLRAMHLALTKPSKAYADLLETECH